MCGRWDWPQLRLQEFCEHHGIQRLSLYGSALEGEVGPKSDVDVLVEFRPESTPGFLALADMEEELAHLLGVHRVILHTPLDLNPHIREQVMQTAQVRYAL